MQITAKLRPLTAPPRALFRLRWRIKTAGVLDVVSAWTPQTRYPLIGETFAEHEGRITSVAIDAERVGTRDRKQLLSCPGARFKKLSYKGMLSLSVGRTMTIGIEVEDVDGNRFLVLRDGTVHVEEAKA